MERTNNKIEFYSRIFFAVIFSVGVLGHSFLFTKNYMLMLTPFVLLISYGILFYFVLKTQDNNFLIWIAATFIFTLICEIIGVNTGLIFGDYVYGKTLGIKFLGVPPIIGMNWIFVIIGAYQISERITQNQISRILISALLSVGFDFILEPVAIRLDYWTWSAGEIPSYNYFSWFLISMISLLVLSILKAQIQTKIFEYFLVVQVMFFLLLNFVA